MIFFEGLLDGRLDGWLAEWLAGCLLVWLLGKLTKSSRQLQTYLFPSCPNPDSQMVVVVSQSCDPSWHGWLVGLLVGVPVGIVDGYCVGVCVSMQVVSLVGSVTYSCPVAHQACAAEKLHLALGFARLTWQSTRE